MLPTLDCHPAQQQVLLYALSTDVLCRQALLRMKWRKPSKFLKAGNRRIHATIFSSQNYCFAVIERWAKVYLDHVRWRVELATFLEWQA